MHWTDTIFAGLAMLMISATGVFGQSPDADRAWLIERFNKAIVPAVEASLAGPASNEQGGIAWGQSYQLSALAEMLDATRDSRYADLFVRLGGWTADGRDDRHDRRDEFRNRVVPAWGSRKYTNGRHYAWAVHTGMIVEPMARFAAIVRQDKVLSGKYGNEAERFLPVAEEAVAVHDDQYRKGPAPDEGYLFGLFGQIHLPLNMQNALARAWIAIDDARDRKEPVHRDRTTALATFFKNRLRPTDDGCYVWAYRPPLAGADSSFEDVSHASINADFVVLCFERKIVFTDADIDRLAKTLLTKVFIEPDAVANNVGGTGGADKYRPAPFRWGRLAKHRAAVRDRLLAFCRAGAADRPCAESELLGIAHLVAALKMTDE